MATAPIRTHPAKHMEGLLLVNKPKGWTSFDVVNHVRKIVSNHLGVSAKRVKVGHSGTLDPLATGLLVILVGKKYTKKAMSLTKQDKVYEVEFELGITSPSLDTETKTTPVSNAKPTKEQIEKVIKSLIGEISQVPPAYSAIKINGQRAYDLARKGHTVDMKPRKVMIHSIELISYKYPMVKLVTEVSSGTYVRSLVRDIGLGLKTGAVMTKLTRTRVGKFDLGDSIDVSELSDDLIRQHLIEA